METNVTKVPLRHHQVLRSVNARLRHLDVDDLYLLSLLGQGKRLSDAARALSLSQPAITQRVHKIENSVGFPILERTSRQTRLTERGLTFCQYALDAVMSLERFFSQTHWERVPAVAASDAWSAWLLAQLVSGGQIPDLGIDVEFLSPESIRREIENRDGFSGISMVVSRGDSVDKSLGLTTVKSAQRAVRLWLAGNLNPNELVHGIPLIHVSREGELVDEPTQRMIEQAAPWIKGVRYGGTVAGAIAMASRGLGVFVALEGMSDPALVPVLAELDLGTVTFDLAMPERAPENQAMERVRAIFR